MVVQKKKDEMVMFVASVSKYAGSLWQLRSGQSLTATAALVP